MFLAHNWKKDSGLKIVPLITSVQMSYPSVLHNFFTFLSSVVIAGDVHGLQWRLRDLGLLPRRCPRPAVLPKPQSGAPEALGKSNETNNAQLKIRCIYNITFFTFPGYVCAVSSVGPSDPAAVGCGPRHFGAAQGRRLERGCGSVHEETETHRHLCQRKSHFSQWPVYHSGKYLYNQPPMNLKGFILGRHFLVQKL